MADRIEVTLLAVVAKYCKPSGPLTLDAAIETIGIDSLTMSEIVFELEDTFAMSVPEPAPGTAVEFITLRDIHAAVTEALASRKVPAPS